MSTPASIKKHPIHPMLIVLPIGLWIFSLVCDLIYFTNYNTVWRTVAFYAIGGGIVGALLAAVPGLIDYLSLRRREVKRIATIHMVLNLIVVALFAVNFGLRWENPQLTFPVWISLVSILILAYSGWLGGAMVYEHGVGVSQTPVEEAARSREKPSHDPLGIWPEDRGKKTEETRGNKGH